MDKLNTSSKIHQEFYLENVVEKNLQFSRTFLIPTKEELDDYTNAKIISLEDVLSFEPLLEEVFSNFGYAYEYSEAENKFIEVKE